jgi:polyribonucleotide nucleotidyltransferase
MLTSIDKQAESLNAWDLVEITWRDAYDAPNGWTDTDSYKPEDQIARTVGYVWKGCQTNYVTLCGTMFDLELPKIHTVGNVTHVPTAMIQSINVINKKQRRMKDERIQIHGSKARSRKPRMVDRKMER